MRLLDDIASNQTSIFSSECQLFPMSIQLQTSDALDIAQGSLQLGEDVESLERVGAHCAPLCLFLVGDIWSFMRAAS